MCTCVHTWSLTFCSCLPLTLTWLTLRAYARAHSVLRRGPAQHTYEIPVAFPGQS